MIQAKLFYDLLTARGTKFFTGVPDSLLKNFCAYITDTTASDQHIIAANEGNAVALAAGWHLATGAIPLVYMQNSGIGNAVNPLLSLVDPEVYKIPLILLIGWRGEPEVHDEPQHIKQGKVTCGLLDTMGIPWAILPGHDDALEPALEACYASIAQTGTPYAFIARKGSFAPWTLGKDQSMDAELSREEAIEAILLKTGKDDVFVSTTGMASRELYELRNKQGKSHQQDFLTVGSMGHASGIALSISMVKRNKRVFCIDGDGALIMHMGSLAIIGTRKEARLIHIVLNNSAHDSVGGQATVASNMDIPALARACGYAWARRVSSIEEINSALDGVKDVQGPVLIEIRVRKGARKDLGRPKESPVANKQAFVSFLNK